MTDQGMTIHTDWSDCSLPALTKCDGCGEESYCIFIGRDYKKRCPKCRDKHNGRKKKKEEKK